MNNGTKTKYKRYDEAFKRSAVEHWLVSGKSARQIAAELGVNQQSLQQWKAKFKMLPAGQVAPARAASGAAAARHSKKNLGYNLGTERERFVRIEAMQEEYSIAQLCAALNVARSGYHAWAARVPGPRAQANATLWPLIERAYEKSRQTYGSPRICQQLKQQGHGCSRQRVARLMRGHQMKSQSKRRFRVALTDSNHDSADCAQSTARRHAAGATGRGLGRRYHLCANG